MSESDHEREKRALALRPRVEKKLAISKSRRQAATEIGVSDTALAQFLAGNTPYHPTLDLYEAWVSGGGGTSSRHTGTEKQGLSRQIDEILHSDVDELTKTGRMIDLWGIYRQQAIADVSELLRGDQEILKLRASAVADLARTTRLETEEATRRREEISSGRKALRAARAVRGARPKNQQGAGENVIERGGVTVQRRDRGRG